MVVVACPECKHSKGGVGGREEGDCSLKVVVLVVFLGAENGRGGEGGGGIAA